MRVGAFRMDTFQWVVLVVLWAVTVVPGVPALSHGWVLPWLRQGIRSLRLSGLSDITMGLAGTVAIVSAGWDFHSIHARVAHAGMIACVCLCLCGLGMALMARRVSWGTRSKPSHQYPVDCPAERSDNHG